MSYDLLTFVCSFMPNEPAYVLRWSVVDGDPMLHETIPLSTASFPALMDNIAAHCRAWPSAKVALSPSIAAAGAVMAVIRERLPGRRLIAMGRPPFGRCPPEITGSTPAEREGRWMAEYVVRTEGARKMGDVIPFRPPELGYTLGLLFDTDAPEFCRGFETGLLYARLDAQPATWAGTYHAANAEMIRRVAANADYLVEIEPLAEGWIAATFFPRVAR